MLLKRLREKYGCHDAFEDYLTIECDWAHPLLIFLAVYIFVYNKKFVTKKRDDIMPIDISPIKDLFVIRNQVLAHPRAQSIVSGTGVESGKGLKEDGKPLSLKKFIHLPNIYLEFTYDHAKEIYDATSQFIKDYRDLLANNPTDPTLSGLFS